jgi:hypothetical protein
MVGKCSEGVPRVEQNGWRVHWELELAPEAAPHLAQEVELLAKWAYTVHLRGFGAGTRGWDRGGALEEWHGVTGAGIQPQVRESKRGGWAASCLWGAENRVP